MDISHINLSAIKNFIKDPDNKVVQWSKKAFSSIGEQLKNFPPKSIRNSSEKHRAVKESFKELTSNAINDIKVFFEKSPTIGEIYKDLGITADQWNEFPKELKPEIIKIIISANNGDKSASYKYILSNRLAYELNFYIEHSKENKKEIQWLLDEVKQNIENLKPEYEREVALNTALGSNKNPSRKEKAEAISKVYGGESIKKDFNLNINTKDVKVFTEVIPQCKLSEIPGEPDLKQVSSEFGGDIAHATNLWQQNITVDKNKPISFIRCGNTRGKEAAAKEILANALSLKFKSEDIQDAIINKKTLELNFSNIQLMTPGKIDPITDGDMPFNQMQRFIALSNQKKP